MLKPRFALVFSTTLALASWANAAKLMEAVGTVRLTSKGATTTVTERSAFPVSLAPGQHVETDSAARARLVLDDASEITIGSSAEFVVPAPKTGSSAQSIPQLLYGLFRVLVQKHLGPGESWQIQSGSAVMGVRGTDFVVDASRDRTMMCTFTGAVDIHSAENPTHSVRVRANEGVVVSSEGKVSAPVAMDPRQMDWWREETAVGAPRARDVPLRTIGEQWQWDGPTAADSLDPNALFSQFQMITAHPTLWGFASQTENTSLGSGVSYTEPNLTARGVLDALFVPNRGALIFVQPTAAMKSGHANYDSAGFHLNQAFLTARLESTHSLTLGRQQWQFGDGLLIGREPWQPFTRSYDGALATLRWAPAKIRIFGSTLEDRNTTANINDWMVGAYAELSKIPAQLYAIWVTRDGTGAIASSNDLQARYGIFGERLETQLAQWAFVDEEFAYEAGKIGTPVQQTETLSSYLGYFDAGVAFETGRFSGSFKGVYLAASGDRNPGNGTYTAFVPLLNDTHRFLGLVNAFAQIRNIQRAGASFSGQHPLLGRPFTARLDYSHFSRMTTNDLVYPKVASTDSSTLGDEVDLQFSYEVLSSVNAHVGGGCLLPGTAFGGGQQPAYLAFVSGELTL